MSNTKFFTFFNDDTNVSQIKNRAKKLVKSKKEKSLSSALNLLSKQITSLSFNKSVKIAESNSPFLFNGKMHFPISVNGQNAFVIIDQTTASIYSYDNEDEFSVNLTNHITTPFKITDTTFLNIKKMDSQWTYIIPNNESLHIQMQATDEGVVIDLFYLEEIEPNVFSPICLDSTYIFTGELFSEEDDFE